MAIESPEDVEGREIPPDTAKPFGAGGGCGNVHDENETGARGDGSGCPVRGCGAGDGGRCHAGGTRGFRPRCGRKAADHAY